MRRLSLAAVLVAASAAAAPAATPDIAAPPAFDDGAAPAAWIDDVDLLSSPVGVPLLAAEPPALALAPLNVLAGLVDELEAALAEVDEVAAGRVQTALSAAASRRDVVPDVALLAGSDLTSAAWALVGAVTAAWTIDVWTADPSRPLPARWQHDAVGALERAGFLLADAPELACGVNLALARVEVEVGLLSEALALLTASRCTEPARGHAVALVRGFVEARLGRDRESERTLVEAGPRSDPMAEATRLLILADLAARRGLDDVAGEHLGRVAALDVRAGDVLVRRAELLRRRGDLAGARALLDAATVTDPLLKAWVERRRVELALLAADPQAAQRALFLEPTGEVSALRSLDIAVLEGAPAAAAASPVEGSALTSTVAGYAALAARAADPRVAEEAAFKAAWGHLRLGRFQDAAMRFAELLTASPASELADLALQGVRLALERTLIERHREGDDLAVTMLAAGFLDVLRADGKDALESLHRAVGESYERVGLGAEAEPWYEAGLAAHPARAEARRLALRLAARRVLGGSPDDAERLLASHGLGSLGLEALAALGGVRASDELPASVEPDAVRVWLATLPTTVRARALRLALAGAQTPPSADTVLARLAGLDGMDATVPGWVDDLRVVTLAGSGRVAEALARTAGDGTAPAGSDRARLLAAWPAAGSDDDGVARAELGRIAEGASTAEPLRRLAAARMRERELERRLALAGITVDTKVPAAERSASRSTDPVSGAKRTSGGED